MTVYVDDMAAKFGRMIMCHMVADTEAELHAMAAAIGIHRKWYQGDHYDIAKSKRALAVKAGAVEITWWQLGCMLLMQRHNQLHQLPDPATAELWQARRRAAGARRADP